MRHTWLRTNRRVLLLGMILPAALMAIGLVAALALPAQGADWMRMIGWAMIAAGIVFLALVAAQWRVPRIAYADGQVLLYLRSGRPIDVPVQCLECFFLASGTGQIPGPMGRQIPLRNLVLRVAEKATDFQQRTVKPALGRWEGGYVTIYGAWCEPLDLELVKRLNAQLADAQQAHGKSMPRG